MTTVVEGSAEAAERIGVGDTSDPVGSSCAGNLPPPEASAATAWSAIAHCPSVEIPIGVMRYFAGSAAANTWAAVVHETSCSALSPPKTTIRWIRSSVSIGVPLIVLHQSS